MTCSYVAIFLFWSALFACLFIFSVCANPLWGSHEIFGFGRVVFRSAKVLSAKFSFCTEMRKFSAIPVRTLQRQLQFPTGHIHTMRDRASVNDVALRTLKVIYPALP